VPDTIAAIRSRFNTFAKFPSVGNTVSGRDLDYLNRANKWLSQFTRWDNLNKKAALVLISGKTYQIPTDCAQVNEIYSDSDSDGHPEYYYYNRSQNRYNGVYFSSTYDKATGTTNTVTFISDVTETPYIGYTQVLPDFSGSGTEYPFWPSELILRCAQKLYIEDKGIVNDGDKFALQAFEKELANYWHTAQNQVPYVNATPKDRYGIPMFGNCPSLDGGNIAVDYYSFDPKRIY
jgi:hypothetical protein